MSTSENRRSFKLAKVSRYAVKGIVGGIANVWVIEDQLNEIQILVTLYCSGRNLLQFFLIIMPAMGLKICS